MSSNAKLYKTITLDEFEKLQISIDRRYSYFSENDVKELKEQAFEENKPSSNLFQLIDNDYEWNPKIHSLFLDIDMEIKNPSIIFGKTGSCYEDAIIGIGLVYKSEKSKIKNCVKLGEFKNTLEPVKITKNHIEVENLSSNATFKLIFYISKPGSINGNNYFANETGMIIFEQNAWTIIVDGNASVFPIYEIEDDNGPLWSFDLDIFDISEDLFDKDHIKILINRKHPAYPMIHHKSTSFNKFFINEILSNAIASIIMEIRSKQKDNHFDLELDCEQGSILQALKYYKNILDFDIDGSFNSLLNSIKNYFDKEVSL